MQLEKVSTKDSWKKSPTSTAGKSLHLVLMEIVFTSA
jgi:hypothetical protein